MRPLNEIIIPLTAVTIASVTNSQIIPAMQLFYISAQIVVSSGAFGTLKMQATNDQPTDSSAPSNWVDIAGATVTPAANGAFMIPKTDICYQYVRFVYTATAVGSIKVTTKALGA